MERTVRHPTPEEQLRTRVMDELDWDALVDASQIDVSVASGVVTLVGTVSSYAQLLAAQQAARAVAGVHDLINEIDVKPAATHSPTDDELRHIAERVLAWDALVPNQNLRVSVIDGWVRLAGTVSVDSQRIEAERAVGHLTGVRGITNDVEVGAPDLTPDDVRSAIRTALQRRAEHRAKQIDVTIEGSTVTLEGKLQSEFEKVAILGAVSHSPGIARVCDDLTIEPPT